MMPLVASKTADSIRVLVVDDSVVARRFLIDAVDGDPSLEVVGFAATGAIALQKIVHVAPEVVVLDFEMPDMDGIETVTRIHAEWPNIAVIMCSSVTLRGAELGLRALAAGAVDCIAKPLAGNALAPFAEELRAKIRAVARPSGPRSSSSPSSSSVSPSANQRVSAIAIGCSTGGPNALSTVYASLPKDLGVPILIVQHMPPLFTRMLAERLSHATGLSVVEASDGEAIVPDRTYIAPGDFHMTVTDDLRIALDRGPSESSCRPAVDPLFRSVARVFGSETLGLVMTGMGHDGARGARAIVDAGGRVIVQDEASCVVPSMPGAVEAAGLADSVHPLGEIGAELVARVRRGRNGGEES